MYKPLLLSCSASCDPLLRGNPTHTQHNLPSVRELQKLIHNLPLQNADTQQLQTRSYPDGALSDGTYLRVLQVGERFDVHRPIRLHACMHKIVQLSLACDVPNMKNCSLTLLGARELFL